MKINADMRYGAVSRLLHWVAAILVLVAFIYGPGGSELRVYDVSRDFERQLHETLGMAVFLLTLVRIVWRRIEPTPRPVPMPARMELAAKGVQSVLYLLLLAVPLTAMAGAWLEGHSLTLMAGVSIPAPIAASHVLGLKIAELHGWLGDTILWIAGLHAVAAIYHHAVLKDAVLLTMLPESAADRLTNKR